MNSRISVYTDGGARGNPGPSATGVYIEDGSGEELASFGKKIGIATNNVAEYTAVINALDWIIENKKTIPEATKIEFFLDSKLACSQILGIFRVKNSNLKELLLDVRNREAQIKNPIFYKHIPREKNKKADRMVNIALDEKPYD